MVEFEKISDLALKIVTRSCYRPRTTKQKKRYVTIIDGSGASSRLKSHDFLRFWQTLTEKEKKKKKTFSERIGWSWSDTFQHITPKTTKNCQSSAEFLIIVFFLVSSYRIYFFMT